jgi:Ca-activated chloride channel family protein
LLVPVCLAFTSAEAFSWNDLWLRPDQQGQDALQAGHTEQAAALFSDPRRKAYAELASGHAAQAAAALAPYRDPESQYNRGNALATQGQLQPALDAYDAALAAAPPGSVLERDARHNRDLVAQQLARLPPQPGQGNRSGGSSAGQTPERGTQAGSGASDKAQSDPGSGDRNPSGAGQNAGDGSAQNSSGLNQSAQQQSASGDSGLGQSNAQRAAAPNAAAGSASGKGSEDSRRPDAAGAQSAAPAAGAGGRDTAGVARRNAAPQSEQTIARDQWLRQIPDDPAGLLRRKFLIEHLTRERDGTP